MKRYRLPIILVIIIFCFVNSSFAQNDYISYYNLIRKAKIHENASIKDSAIWYYKEAVKKVNYVHHDHALAIKKLSRKSKDKSFKQIADSVFLNTKSPKDQDYASKIHKIFESDQRVREGEYVKARDVVIACLKDTFCSKSSEDYLNAKAKLDEWNKIDAENVALLLSWIRSKGFPGERLVGKKANEEAFFILLHNDADFENKTLKPVIDGALLNGDLLPRYYAQIVDRRAINSGKTPVYYVVPLGFNKLSGEEKKSIDAARLSIGLSTVAESQTIIYKKKSIIVRYND